jgi:GNAT superfamily N-acetyltransferase
MLAEINFEMQLIEVKTKEQENEWVLFPTRLYANDPLFIRPIDQEVKDVFDPNTNRVFKLDKSEAIRWMLQKDGKTIGRISAFINGKTYNSEDLPTGGCGFFDCIDDQEAANILFDTALNWLKERGMEAMDGPVNFGERDKNWGVLIDGFAEQNYGMLYNAPYYQKLYESYGFGLYFKQYTFGRVVDGSKDLDARFYERAQQALKNPDITFRYIKKKDFDKAAIYFHHVYSKAWGGHSGVKPMSLEQAQKMFKKLHPVADERLIYFGFYKDEPISFFLSIPELNQLYKHVNGKMNWLGKLKFFYHMKTGSCKKMLGLVFGVIPEWQGKGVESAMVISYTDIAWKQGLPYKTIEMNWIGDFNPKMMKVCEQLGAEIWRTHATYRYLFNRDKEFVRCPIVE